MIIKTVSLRHGFLLGSVLATGLFVSASAVAQSAVTQQTIAIDLAAQPLEQAITQLATQAGLLIGVDASLVAGKQAPALNGRFTPLQAIGQLLKGSGLIVIENAPGRYTLEAAPAGHTNSNTEAVTLPEMKITGMIDPNSPDNRSYSRPSSFSATKTDTRIMETPVSIQVVPWSVMNDQKTPRIKDALENVSGVRPQPSLGEGNAFIIRGFSNGSRIFRNGLGLIGGFGGSPGEFDTANLESIEVLKGPAAVLFGRIEPGGLINITTKRPLDIPYYALEQQFGSYDYYRTVWDAGGPVTENRSLLYRFSGAYQNNNSFRDFVSLDRVVVNPSVTWRVADKTELTVNIEGLNQDFRADFGLPVIGKRPAPIPIGRSLDDPNTPQGNLSHVLVGTDFIHRFNDDWALRNRFLATFSSYEMAFVNPAPAFGNALNENTGIMDRNIFIQESSTDAYTTNLDLTGKFQLGQTRHEILAGFDFTRGVSEYHSRGDWINPNPALAIDIFNPGPSYGIPRSLYDSTLATSVTAPLHYSVAKTEWYGVYFQDRITLWDKLHILGGGRYDWAENGRGRGSSFNAAENVLPSTIRKDSGFSPRVGILYQPWSWLSVYGNWTTSFGANNGISAAGTSFDPQIGEQFEVGIKSALFQEKLITTLTFYNLTKDNLLTPDLSTPDPLDRIAVGRQRSKGIELDISGQITHELSLIGSYAYTDAKVVRDNSGLQGNLMPLAPKHAGSVWLRYDVKKFAPLNGLSFGLGVFAAGKREGDVQNTFQLPGYARLDAFAAYRMKLGPTRLTAQINARNILDKRYYESTDPDSNVAPRLGVYPGAPLTILGSLRLEY
ncbi:TonB-dependent siderophore receptor [Nitrosomonas europaea]|uniref:TonB-dependent siderophore receptor n=2 Tax=Nitrosomonas europaea TaxID=915 RepID=UPI002CE1C24C|nr:TonB-dependent receptor [Nitrosomonas europaea]HRN81821.1 TonB-dependent receptor [Nitrosomonas europaea]